ncbi:solute carrier family 22 member 7 isoform X2 [Chamaea fasciata]|uniref:solute carrier family 22 member 7 isoform X2 n=1 Tax=Chamaea fasciata TaxID=190680 RepID=UPI00336A95A5
MKFEDLLLEIGGFGRFQILILAILCLPRINLPMHFLLHNFLAATPSHHCAIPHQEAFVNLTMEEVLLISIPRKPDGTFSSCEMFSQPQFHLLLNSSLQPENKSIIQHCQHGWVYDHSQFTSTISTQWDLVCEQRGLNQATATFFFIGVTMGAVVFGYLSDRFGRKAMLQLSLVCSVGCGMLSATSVSYTMLAITRTLTGVALSGLSLIVLPLGMEWVDVQHRTFTGILSSIFWSVGNMLLALAAYLVREWHWLLVAVTGPCLLSIVCVWWVPESARWLIAKGRVKQAHRHLLRCARMNGRKDFAVSPEVLTRMATDKTMGGSYSYISLFRTPVLRRISLCSGVVWFGVAFSYYGMSMNLTGFGLSIYLSQFVFGAIEIPAKMVILCLPAFSSGHHGQGFLRSCLHHRLLVHLGALPHGCEAEWDGVHLLHGPPRGGPGPADVPAGRGVAVPARGDLLRGRGVQRGRGIPAAGDAPRAPARGHRGHREATSKSATRRQRSRGRATAGSPEVRRAAV